MTTAPEHKTSGPQPRDKYIPLYFVAFFAVIALVNAVFVYFAVNTHTGVTTDNAYERGLDFNNRLEGVEAALDLGLDATIVVDEADLSLRVNLVGEVEILSATAAINRPTSAAYDFTVPLTQMGDYWLGAVDWPAAGQWDVTVTAETNAGTFSETARVYVDMPEVGGL